MKLLVIFLTLCCMKDTEAEFRQEGLLFCGCSESDEEFLALYNGDKILHSDYEKQKLVSDLPDFVDPIVWPDEFGVSVIQLHTCQYHLNEAKKAYQNPPEALDAPQTSIYPKDDMQLGSENTLICHSARFFPPPVVIRWTKNGEDVTTRATLSQYYPNEDKTYSQFSYLTFTPQEGDVYNCTVEHKALQMPDTKTCDVDVEVEHPNVGPSVFCGVGLVVGLLGVATGTFFLIKGNRCS